MKRKVLCVIAAIIMMTVCIKWISVEIKYKNGVSELRNGEFFSSARFFSDIKDNREKKIVEVVLQYIEDCINENDFSSARYTLVAMEQYEVLSESTVTEYEALVEKKQDEKRQRDKEEANKEVYEEALALISDGQYLDAYHQFRLVLDYGDTEAQIEKLVRNHQEIFYTYAIEIYEACSFELAEEMFLRLGAYENSVQFLSAIEDFKKWMAHIMLAQLKAIL